MQQNHQGHLNLMMSADFSVCLNISFQCLGKIWTKPVFLTSAGHGLAEKPGLEASFQLAEGKWTADRDHTWKGIFFLVVQSQIPKDGKNGSSLGKIESHSSVSYLTILLVPERNVFLYQTHVSLHSFVQNYFWTSICGLNIKKPIPSFGFLRSGN